jgi:hypothetical protein
MPSYSSIDDILKAINDLLPDDLDWGEMIV